MIVSSVDRPRVETTASSRRRLPDAFVRLASYRGAEIVAVSVVLVVVQCVMFAGYYSGRLSPGGDFLGTYNTEAFSWWHDGGLFHPQAWVPQTWGGYPAAAQVQNSSWYLPVGLMAWITPFDIRAASALQAATVAFGGLGMYCLVRRMGAGRLASLVGLVAYTFSTVAFAEAPYPDIVRGFALLPWILLCLSPMWPWQRWWAIPVAALLLWQAAVGIYPGVLVAIGYCGAVWASAWQIALRPRVSEFAGRLLAAGLVAITLAAAKYIPQLGFNSIGRGDAGDLTVLSPSTLMTLLLPSYPGMPGVYSLDLLFVPAAALLLALIARWSEMRVRVAAVTACAALLLGTSGRAPYAVLGFLPGVDASRFRLNDYLPVLVLCVVVAATSGASRLFAPPVGDRRRPNAQVMVALLVPLGAAALAVGVGPFSRGPWVPTFVVLVLTTALVIGALIAAPRIAHQRWWAGAVAVGLIAASAASGIAHSRTVRELWAIDTVAAQVDAWGTTSGRMIEHRGTFQGVRRPGRVPAPADPAQLGSRSYLSGFYTGTDAVGGYFTVHQSPAFVAMSAALADSSTRADAGAFWAASGLIIDAPSDGRAPSVSAVGTCETTGRCGDRTVVPIAYSPGALTYSVAGDRSGPVIANEAYYPGWQALLIDPQGRSTNVPVVMASSGAVQFDLPAGAWRVSLTYVTPYAKAARVAFFSGLVMLVAAAVVGRRAHHRRKRASGPRPS